MEYDDMANESISNSEETRVEHNNQSTILIENEITEAVEISNLTNAEFTKQITDLKILLEEKMMQLTSLDNEKELALETVRKTELKINDVAKKLKETVDNLLK